jgi:hypothetical protein
MPYSDGRSAVLERPIGNGRTLTMTTPISDRPSRDPWNLLTAEGSWPYMILVNQITFYLVGGADEQLNYLSGQTAVLQLNTAQQRPVYLLSGPGGISSPVAPDPEGRRLVITATDQPGNYRVQAGGQNDRFDRGLSVNLGPEQTRLDRISENELKELFGPQKFRVARTKEEINREISTARVGVELFPLLMILLAGALALESVVSNRFYRDATE